MIGQAIGGILFGTLAILLVRRVMANVESTAAASKGPGIFQRQARQIILSFARR